MRTLHVDVAIIGAGTAGLNARRQVEKAGRRALLIESGPYGTMCARVGCMPSKLLIAAADAAYEVRGAGRFGVRVPDGVRVDGRAVTTRVRAERDRFVGFVVGDTEAIPAAQRLRGRARFVGPSSLEVHSEDDPDEVVRVEARAIVVATGSAHVVPPPFAAIRDHIMVNDDVFNLEDLPASLAVIGTGVIGLELGQALARLGVAVDLFNASRFLGPFTDPEVQRVTRAVPIFLAGDVSGHRAVLHEAADEGQIAGANAAAWPDVGVHERRTTLAIAFTDPQMALVGTPWRLLDLATVEIGEASYDDQGRARIAGRNRGLVRLYAERQGCRLIGAEMFGPHMEHLAHLLAWAVQEGMTVQRALRMPFYHPVYEEGLRTALRELAAKLQVTGECACEDTAEAPGA
ncbi:MAG: dihydrolipoyl dehydrogenase [Deltaproteobacteria bacterium]|nr:dihydrolipoyl dehydrogenase [Deltaproteobacteria bacterium]